MTAKKRRPSNSGHPPTTNVTDAPAAAAAAAPAATAGPPTLWPSLLLAVGGGVAYFLGFAGFDVYPFAFVALVPLVLLLERERSSPWRRRAGLAFLYGIVEFAGGYSWMQTFLETFSGFSFPVTVALTAVFCSYLALFTVAFAFIYGRARERGVAPAAVTVAATVALESTFPMIFPSYLGNSLHAVPIAIQIADIGGPVLVSAYLALVNGTLAEAWLAFRATRTLPTRTITTAVLATVFVFGYGAYRMHEVDARAAAAPSLEVAMVQVNMGTFEKREDPMEGHRRHLEQSRTIERALAAPRRGEGPASMERHAGPDLFVWPESAFTFPVPADSQIARVVRRDIAAPVLFGGLDLRGEPGEARPRIYNTAFLLDRAGRVVGRYDKTYLVPFGEYIPFGDIFPSVYEASPNTGHFEAGTRLDAMVLDRARMTVFVCYEDLLPEFTRQLVAHGRPNLLVNLTNDAWYGDTHEPWIHLALSKFRAVEHHRALVRSTNSGVSAFIDPVGRVLAHTGVFTREQLVQELPLLSRGTAFEVTGAYPYSALGLIVSLACVFGRRRDQF